MALLKQSLTYNLMSYVFYLRVISKLKCVIWRSKVCLKIVHVELYPIFRANSLTIYNENPFTIYICAAGYHLTTIPLNIRVFFFEMGFLPHSVYIKSNHLKLFWTICNTGDAGDLVLKNQSIWRHNAELRILLQKSHNAQVLYPTCPIL